MTTSPRRIDHLVLAVHDLDAAAAHYERIGFQVGARNRHPWGTENRLVQFATSFLELITVGDATEIPPHGPGTFSFGAFVRDYLQQREGLAMFVLDSADAVADAAEFADRGIGSFQPFSFERTGRRPDGTPTHVAFTLAFARDNRLPEAAFFVCQQHFPEAFWNPQLQQHGNGAAAISSVTLDLTQPADHRQFLAAFTGRPAPADGHVFPLDHQGRLEVVTGSGANRFTGFTISVPESGPVAQRLSAAGVPFRRLADRLVLGSDDNFGAQLTFEEAGSGC